MRKMLALLVLLAGCGSDPAAPPLIDCPDTTALERYHDSAGTWVGCLDRDLKCHGPFIEYYPDGTMKERGNCDHGYNCGDIEEWDESGHLTTWSYDPCPDF